VTRRRLLATLLLLCGACTAGSNTRRRTAPDFTLPSLDGKMVTLAQFRGRPIVLNFWATWCAPCNVETPWLVQLDAAYRSKGVEFIGVSLDDAGEQQRVADFVRKYRVPYSILLGTPSVADAYGGVRLMPQTFFIAADGTIVRSTIGITNNADLEAAVRNIVTVSRP